MQKNDMKKGADCCVRTRNFSPAIFSQNDTPFFLNLRLLPDLFPTVLQRSRHNRFDRMHSIFRFVEYDGLRRQEYLICNFHLADAEFFAHFGSDDSIEIVKCR